MEYGTCRNRSGNGSRGTGRHGLILWIAALFILVLPACLPAVARADDANGSALRSQVAVATPGATITLPAGIYTLSTPIAVATALTIVGAGSGATFIQSGGDAAGATSSLFRISPAAAATVTLRHMTLRYARNATPAAAGSDYLGGAILFDPSDGASVLSIDGCTVSDSSTTQGDGGGIAVRRGRLNIANSTISNNTAADGVGGGIFAGAGTTISITGSTISGNQATGSIGHGGGICLLGSGGATSTITGSSITNNGAAHDGAGVYTSAPLTIDGSSFVGNHAGRYADDLWNDSGTYGDDDAAPVVSLAATGSYTEGSGARAIDPSLIVSDGDSMYLASATVTLDSTPDGNAESLTADVGGTAIVASYSRTSGRIIVTLSQIDRLDNYQKVLRSISYSNTSQNPSTAPRNVGIKVSDGSRESLERTLVLGVTAVNTPPTVAFTRSSYDATEQTTLNLHATGISIADVDAGSGSVTATFSVTEGTLSVSASSGGVTVSNSGTPSVTMNGTIAQINALLAGGGGATVLYYNGSDAPASAVSLTLLVNDNGNTGGGTAQSGSAGRTIGVTTVNDPPALVVNAGLTLYQNAGQTVIGPDRLRLGDADNPATSTLVYTLTAVPAKGVLKKNGTALTTGDRFSQADLDGNLVSFTPDGTTNGADSFAGTYSDGLIPAPLGPATFVITINPAYTLTVTREGSGAGTVTAAGCTLNWSGGSGSCTVLTETTITLSAAAGSGSAFTGWSGGSGPASGCGGTGDCTFTLSRDAAITGTFLPLFRVTPTAGAHGSISPDTPRTLAENSSATFTIRPAAGYHVVIPVGGSCGGLFTGNPNDPTGGIAYTTNAITADCTIEAAFAYTPNVTIDSTGSGNGAWSGTAPAVWTPNGARATVSTVEIESRLNAGTSVVIETGGDGEFGDILVKAPLSWNGSTLTLRAERDIRINAGMTASGTARLDLETDGGTVYTGLSASGFYGRVDFPGRSGAGFLTINGEEYSVIDSLGTEYGSTGINLQGIYGVGDTTGSRYALGADIDAAATAGWKSEGENYYGFMPLGGETGFNGIFDGLGHRVVGLTIHHPESDNTGLFASTGSAAVIRNLGLAGGSIAGANHVGGLVGNNAGTIGNAYTSGSVAGHDYVGGLAGQNDGRIDNSFATGSVSGGNSYAGGLVGWNHGNSISNCFSTGAVTGGSYVGGLVGENYLVDNLCRISDSYSSGSVHGAMHVGGLAGFSWGDYTNVYSSGAVSATTSTNVGGLLGGKNAGTVTGGFWDTETSGQAASAGGIGKSTVEMRQVASFGGWDISATGGSGASWRIYEGQTYPLLRSLVAPLTVTANNDTKPYDSIPYSGGNGVSYSVTPNTNLYGSPGYSGDSQGATAIGSYAIIPAGLSSDQRGYDISYGYGTLTIVKATATVTLGNLSQGWDGTPKTVTAVTDPAGLAVDVTYDGGGTAPSAVGSYAVVATVNDVNYQGSVGGTLVITPVLNVAVTGSGTGTVTSVPSGIACTGGSCSQTFTGTVNLYATPSALSLFGGWSGSCTGTSSLCSITMGGNRSVTATFNPAPLLRIGGTDYPTLQAAYDAAASGAFIQLLDGGVAGTLTAGRNVAVSLMGGYDAGYATTPGSTPLTAPLTVGLGQLTLDRIVIR